MQQQIRIGIADDNQEFCQLLQDYFLTQPEINVATVVNNGLEAIEALQETPIDVLLLDMIMPQMDGLGVLQWLRNQTFPNKPKIIIFSAFGQEEVTRNAVSLGVDYYILKPFDLNVLTRRIIETVTKPIKSLNSQRQPRLEYLEIEVTRIIQSLRIPSHFKGYTYLREAILLTAKDPSLINEVTKRLYPLIAEHYDTTKHRVERSMRFAIETAWSKGDMKTLYDLFGYCVDDKKGKPTNASFIAKISDKIRLENKGKV